MPEQEHEKQYYSVAGIKKKFNVTDAVIKKLGDPDLVVDNPHYKGASEMKLYKIERVDAFMAHLENDMKGYLAKMRNRKSRAKRAVETKRKTMIKMTREFIKNLAIEPYDAAKIPELTEKQFIIHEIDRFGDVVHEWNGGFNAEVAYIRHNLTNYEDVLERIKGRVGVSEAYQSIKAALNDKIIADYKSRMDKDYRNEVEIIEREKK